MVVCFIHSVEDLEAETAKALLRSFVVLTAFVLRCCYCMTVFVLYICFNFNGSLKTGTF